jgi:pimeloyl-ACP methyl ester carboxylesterase
MKIPNTVEFDKERHFDFSRRTFLTSMPMAAVGTVAFGQSIALSAIVRTDAAELPAYGNSTLPASIRSRLVNNINGLSMHILEAGTKGRPCILLLHGFPELGYCWRKIMLPLADAGYYVVAPDQRGYGRTTGWDDDYDGDIDSFRRFNLVRDTLGLVSALGYRSIAAVVGHDHGSPNAAYCALLRPDVFCSVALVSSPFGGPPQLPFDTSDLPQPSRPPNPLDDLAKLEKPKKHYQDYYRSRDANANMQHPPQGLHAFLRAYYHYKSADFKDNKPFKLASYTASELAKMPPYYILDSDKGMAETVASKMPSATEIASCKWLTDAELDVFATEFSRTGFQGGLNWYRIGVGKYATELELLSGRTIDVPACFIAGSGDWNVYQVPGLFERMQTTACTQWRGTYILEGAGHWVQQEQPEKVSQLILQFLRG